MNTAFVLYCHQGCEICTPCDTRYIKFGERVTKSKCVPQYKSNEYRNQNAFLSTKVTHIEIFLRSLIQK